MDAAGWNKAFEEERMRYTGVAVTTAAPRMEIWRTVPDTNNSIQVSNQGRIRKTNLANILAGKKGKLLSDHEYDVQDLIDKVFPLEKEAL